MDLPQGRSAVTLITSMVELARTLGLDIVAEGVETEEQRQALADLDCGSAQGYCSPGPSRPTARAQPSRPAAGAPAAEPAGRPV